MIVSELKKGDSFYFTGWPAEHFIFIGIHFKHKRAMCVPAGRLYCKYFSTQKQVIKINYGTATNTI